MNVRKRLLLLLLFLCSIFLFAGCGEEEEDGDVKVTSLFKSKFVVGKDIVSEDITDFYFTRENINYDAFFQRYRFYVEDGKHMFFHETRERKNDYGPATESDRTALGTRELSDDEWKKFYGFVCDGTVTARKDSAESGDSGPWTFLYWKEDKGKYQLFDFSSYKEQDAFEEYCISLAQTTDGDTETTGSAEHRYGELRSFTYHPGYCDMSGANHNERLGKNKDGEWTIECRDRESFEEPFIVRVYSVSEEAVEEFTDFLYEKDIPSLQERPDSDLFVTDYSAWYYGIEFSDESGERAVWTSFSIKEYKEYSDADRKVIKELGERFENLKESLISETEEEED
ncbi:MAG: hypothetical protein K5697_16895 [Lachnospiraceae bacterium]|nr:hypothetical protein [Lachnospiraceae bacterium]